jgi:ubiquinone/menaquinone biosynthesis C-methylase UbiE
MDVAKVYRSRFESMGLERRVRVWKTLCKDYFNRVIGEDKDVLDLACGYGEFINNISARSKIGVDLNQDAYRYLAADIRFVNCAATNMTTVAGESVDVVFTSNFLEHLSDKAECDRVFREVKRILRIGGRFIVMGPNIRYAYKEYWDYYDHQLPLSHRSLEEGLNAVGFDVITNIPRFLPFTMKGRKPTADLAVKLYLSMPFVWPVFGKQFLVIAQKGELNNE